MSRAALIYSLLMGCASGKGTLPDSAGDVDSGERSDPGGRSDCVATTEECDGMDNDCDGLVDEGLLTTWFADADGDGYGDATVSAESCGTGAGWVIDATDCDDSDVTVNPGAHEPCSGGDVNCDGVAPDACASCLDWRDAGETSDGLYTIAPDGGAEDVWCDMQTDGGGWTLVQRTVWDWQDTSQLLTTYADWYANTVGGPSPGFAYRLSGSAWAGLNQELDHMLVLVPRDADTHADCASLTYLGAAGRLEIDRSAASIIGLISPVTMVNSPDLSATDTGPGAGCVTEYDAVPWFYSSCCTTCPTFFGSYWDDEAHPMVSYSSVTPDLFGNVETNVCASNSAVSSHGYSGQNVMEYYLR